MSPRLDRTGEPIEDDDGQVMTRPPADTRLVRAPDDFRRLVQWHRDRARREREQDGGTE
jgi:hypothetical protein